MVEKRFGRLACWLLLLFAGAAGVQPAALAAGRAAIGGQITDYATARPIGGASVTLAPRGGAPRSVSSDARGVYRIEGLEEGLYDVSVDAAGYRPAARLRARAIEGATVDVDFALVRAAAADVAEVTVTARPITADPLAGVSAVRLDREEIRRSPGTAGDVFRGLDTLPGVASTGEFSQFAVRGNGQRENLILIDGIPFDKVVHFAQSLGEQDDIGGGGRYSIFAPNLVASAEFQPGGWRAAYGGKNGSLLQLELADGARESAFLSAQLDVAGAELGYEGPSGLREDTTLLLSARRLDFERLFEAIDNEDIGAPALTDLIAKAVSEPNERHRLELLAIHTTERYVRDVENVLASESFEDTSLAASEQDSSLLGFTWKWFPGERARVRNTLYVRDSDKWSSEGEAFPDLAGADPTPQSVPLRPDILTLREGERELGWRGDFSSVLASGDLVSFGALLTRLELDFETRLAGEWIRYVYDRDDFRADPAQRYIVLTPERVDARFADEATRAALYADYAWRLGAFTLTPGLRYDYEGFAGDSLVSPRLSLDWQPRETTRLWVGGGVYHQYPSHLELAADPANARLASPRSTQVALGVQHFPREDLRLSAEVYHQRLDDLVVVADRTSGRADNLGEGTNTGVDLALIKRLTSSWWGSASYSWLRSKRDDGLGEGGYDSDQHRPHVLTLFGAWEPSERWAFSAKWKYASGRPADAFVVHANVLPEPGPLRFAKEITGNNTGRFPAFHALNVRVDYRRRFGPVSLIGFVDVINVYGRENLDEREWDERRGLEVEDGLEVFPSIGLEFEYVWSPGTL